MLSVVGLSCQLLGYVLSDGNKVRLRLNTCLSLLSCRNKTSFLGQILSGDENWVKKQSQLENRFGPLLLQFHWPPNRGCAKERKPHVFDGSERV